MIRHRPEEPLVLKEGPTFDLAVKVAKWIEERKPSESKSSWVAGVYGGRGTGKTSFLWTVHSLLDEQRKQAAQGGSRVPYVLPTVNLSAEATFTPSATRAHDDILFMFLDHLKRYRRRDKPLKGFAKARTAEVMRKDTARFLAYESEIATSSKSVPGRFRAVHTDVAQTTRRLQGAFGDIIRSLKDDDEVLPILVDDLDLQPQRALELLEILHLFMNVPGVVVLVAADKNLLLRSIERALKAKERNIEHPGLASALLAKYVPHEWHLPIPSELERVNELWGDGIAPAEDSEIKHWWHDGALQGLREAITSRRAQYQARRDTNRSDERPADEEDKALPKTPREFIEQSLGPYIPASYRGIKALHNRLASWRERLGSTRSGVVPIDWRTAAQREYGSLRVNRLLLTAFLAKVAAIDVRWPDLELLTSVEQSPAAVAEALHHLVVLIDPSAAGEAKMETALGERSEDFPVLSHLIHGSHLGQAKRSIQLLAREWAEWQQKGSGVAGETRFIAISMRSDAVAESRPIWSALCAPEDVAAWHVDLRPHVERERPTPQDIDRARMDAWERVRAQLAIFTGRIEFYASAPLSLLLWLGWALDDRRAIVFYNARTKKPFEGPTERIMFPDKGFYELCKEPEGGRVHDPEGEDGHATVLVLLTPSRGDVDHFYRDGKPVRAKVRTVLRRSSGAPIEPEDLVPLLKDVLELFGQLHRDEGIRHRHLAFAGPDAVAFFLGRALKASGMRVSLYERYGDRHEHVFDLES